MDRLSLVISMFTGAVATGAAVTTVMVLGLYSWLAIGIAAAFGWIAAWPLAYGISRWIKREDPHFDHTRAKDKGPIPDPTAREV